MPTVTQARRIFTFTSPLGEDAFAVTEFNGIEELSHLFRFHLTLVSENTSVAAADLVGKEVSWTLNFPEDTPRKFHGFVRRMTLGPFIGRVRRTYHIEVVPWLWFLTQATNCKIYQNKTALDIIKDVFGEFGFTEFRTSVQGTLATREYCVQYRETAFDFVSRLMEEEGIYYFFEFADASHTLVLSNDAGTYYDCDPHAAVEYRPEWPDAIAISSWERQFEYHSGKWTLTDYNFETPATSLLKNTPSGKPLTDTSKYEVFDYPGRYKVSETGGALSKVRMEEVEVRHDNASGSSRCSSFAPGAKFTLENHPSDNESFVFLAVEHNAVEGQTAGMGTGQASYNNNFRCMPSAVPFRPARVTPRPRVYGPQPAVVVGPSGEEIYTDKYGRIKAQFYWDRVGTNNENSSCWMRVAEMWAGKNWGMISTPRIGQEVIIEFLEGDPDNPIVTGRVYNSAQMPPYTLPDNMTQSGMKSRSTKTGGTEDFNELRFEDKKGNETVYFHAQKDFQRYVEHDDDLQVLGNQTITITGDRTEIVDKGNETITIKTGDRTEEVSTGNETVTVKTGKRTVTVESDDTHTVKTGNRVVTVETGDDTHTVKTGNRNATVETGNENVEVKVGDIIIKATAKTITLEAGQSITLKAGSAQIVIGPTDVEIKGVNLKFTADAQASLKANAQVEVNSSGIAVLKGGVVQIN